MPVMTILGFVSWFTHTEIRPRTGQPIHAVKKVMGQGFFRP